MKKLTLVLDSENEGIYTVQQGDTLDSLAIRFSTPKDLIVKDNFLSSDIEVGDRLYIKRYKKVYVVAVGDTPELVAKRLNLTVDELFRINKINYVYPYMQVVGYE